MKKTIILLLWTALLLTGCAGEFNKVYKTTDYQYKYEYAKECFARGKYSRATTLLQELVTLQKGTDNAEESLYMLGMSEYCMGDYETASDYFKKYFQTYPKGKYAEEAEYYIGESLFMGTPVPELDQSQTLVAIAAFQEYLDVFPDAKYKTQAQDRLFALQDKLVEKELQSAYLYYNLGHYFGNSNMGDGGSNYLACVVTSQNALNDYPYSDKREEFSSLIFKSKFELAKMSVESKQMERFQDAEDECYGFVNEFPDSKDRTTAEKYIEHCKEWITKHPELANPLNN